MKRAELNIFCSKVFSFLAKLWFAIIGLGFSFGALAQYGNPWQANLIKGVTKVSHQIYDVHMIVVWVSLAVAIGVFSVLIYSMINHRKSKHPTPATFHENVVVEFIWTIIPLIILIGISIPATKSLLNAKNVSNFDMSIRITGYQWKWRYEYVGKGISFFSSLADADRKARYKDPTKIKNYNLNVDHPLVIPVGKKVRFLITSNDVIHSWWVPQIGVKQDAIPGYINTAWTRVDKPGTYRGQCAELCGKGHAYMPIVLVVKSQADYAAWVVEQKKQQKVNKALSNKKFSLAELITRGKAVFSKNCVACHGATGAGIPGVFPALTGSLIATGKIKAHVKRVLFGVAGTAMQAFGKQLSDADIASVVTYERNRLGNSVGDMIQPSEVKALRGK